MKFKDTIYGDLTNKKYKNGIDITGKGVTSFEGSPKIVENFIRQNNKITNFKGSPQKIHLHLNMNNNDLISLEGCTKYIGGTLFRVDNKNLKNTKEQVIKYQIQASEYYFDEGYFSFQEIKEEFEKYGNFIENKEKREIKKLLFKEKNKKKSIINQNDYGLSI